MGWLFTALIAPAALAPIIYIIAKYVDERLGHAILILASLLPVIYIAQHYLPLFWAGQSLYVERVVIGYIPALEHGVIRTVPLYLSLYLDGISFSLMIMMGVLFAAVYMYTKDYIEEEGGVPLFLASCAVLTTALFGVFIVSNFIAFYLFWELMTIVSFFVLLKWCRQEVAFRVSMTFLLFSAVGAHLLLAGIALILLKGGAMGIELLSYMNPATAKEVAHMISDVAYVAGALMFIGFATKMALFPLHVWLPIAHGEAPAPMSAILSGVLAEAGAYGIIRFTLTGVLSCFLSEQICLLLALLGCLTGIYAGIHACIELDVKRIVAYSTIAHMGYIMIGTGVGSYAILALGAAHALSLEGALYHLLTHAWNKGLWFLIAGVIMHETGRRNFREIAGLIHHMPITAFLAIITLIGIAGIAPFSCYVSAGYIASGIPLAGEAFIIVALLMIVVKLFSAAYSLRYFILAFVPRDGIECHAHEPPLLMLAGMAILAAFVVISGIAPQIFTGFIEKAMMTTMPQKVIAAAHALHH